MTQPLDLAALEARVEELEAESAALTKALTGLTCGGSEFFTRKGDRYVADIEACVAWVRMTKKSTHRRTVEAILARQAAEARIAELESDLAKANGYLSAAQAVADEAVELRATKVGLEAHLHRANRELEVLKKLHFDPVRGPQDQGGGE